jgi:hypothetical protein
MNSNSGAFADFDTYVAANDGGKAFTADDKVSEYSTNNPANWIWFGSNGLMSAYSYLSSPSLFGDQYNTTALSLNGSTPGPARSALMRTRRSGSCVW